MGKMFGLNDCDTKEKQLNRNRIADWVKGHLKNPRKAKVLCLPGPKILEITKLWDQVGILRRNIWAVTNNDDEYEFFKSVPALNAAKADVLNAQKSGVGMWEFWAKVIAANNPAPKTLKYAMEGKNFGRLHVPVFDVVYFDFYAKFCEEAMDYMAFVRTLLKNGGIFGISLSARRERNKRFLASVRVGREILGGEVGDGFRRGRAEVLFRYISQVMAFGYTKRDFYPTDVLKTRYVAGGTPMITVLGKFRLFGKVPKFKRKALRESKMRPLDITPTHNISYATAERSKKSLTKITPQLKHDALMGLEMGMKPKEIAEYMPLTPRQISCIQAHKTMGTYDKAVNA